MGETQLRFDKKRDSSNAESLIYGQQTGNPGLCEFVRFQTRDRVSLHALLWRSPIGGRTLALYVPGMGGGFSCPNDLNSMAREMGQAGFGFMAMNTRTVGPTGILFSRFEDCVDDIDAAVGFAVNNGYHRVVLVGDSLGAVRAACYWYTIKTPCIAGMVFMGGILSPYLEAQLRWQADERESFDRFLSIARKLIREGDGEKVVHFPNWAPGRPLVVSASTLINMFGTPDESPANIQAYTPEISIPVLVVHGRNDSIALPENGRRIFESLRSCPNAEFVLTEGDHFFPFEMMALGFTRPIVGWMKQKISE